MNTDKKIKQLNKIYDLIWEDAEHAWQEARLLVEKIKKGKNEYYKARAETLVFILSVIHTIDYDLSQPATLLNYFEKNGYTEDASLLSLWIIRYYWRKGNFQQSIQCAGEYKNKYLPNALFEHKVTYLYFQFALYQVKFNTMNQLETALELVEMLRTEPKRNAWHNYHLALALVSQASALGYSNTGKDKISAIYKEAIELAEKPGVDLTAIFTVYYNIGNTAAINSRNDEALESYYKIEEIFAGKDFFGHKLLLNRLQIIAQLNAKVSFRKISDEEKKVCINEQTRLLDTCFQSPFAKREITTVGSLYMAKQRLLKVTGQYEEGIKYLAKAILLFYRQKNTDALNGAMAEAYLMYQNWAKKTNNPIYYMKAAKWIAKAYESRYKVFMATSQEKMEAVINKYELQKSELNEKLLQQKMKAMKKEVQLTKLNLHEKVKVLDELNAFIISLEKKNKESSQLIRSISKKIKSTIITEQDKSTIAQKLNEDNRPFLKLLSDKYPSLTDLEVHMCGLIQTGMSNKELSKIYGQHARSYEQHRYRIKKKMKLTANDNLVRFLVAFSDKLES